MAIPVTDVRSAVSNAEKAAKLGANFIEFRIDYAENPFEVDLDLLLKAVNIPIILTARELSQGGQYDFEESARINLLRKCILVKPQYLDIESIIPKNKLKELLKLAKNNKVNLICSYHDFKKTSPADVLQEKIDEIASIGFKYIKIVCLATELNDNAIMLSLLQKTREFKLISFCMGQLGIISRVISPLLGSYFTYASIIDQTAPGQVHLNEMFKIHQDFKHLMAK